MTYKTAAELGITEQEHAGLIALGEHLRGQVCTIPNDYLLSTENAIEHGALKDGVIETILGFSMSVGTGVPYEFAGQKYECGCVACIGGHLSLQIQGVDITQRAFSRDELRIADKYVMRFRDRQDHPLYGLFYPHVIKDNLWDRITPSVASEAIFNFLETGDAGWDNLADAHDITLQSDD